MKQCADAIPIAAPAAQSQETKRQKRDIDRRGYWNGLNLPNYPLRLAVDSAARLSETRISRNRRKTFAAEHVLVRYAMHG